jgi:hypothetical protein
MRPDDTTPTMFDFPDSVKDWSYSLTIGFLVVSYWRATWTLFDIWGCGQHEGATLANGDTFCFAVRALEDPEYSRLRRKSAAISYAVGLALLSVGVIMMWTRLWLPNKKTRDITPTLSLIRFFMIYCLGAAAVCIWRGIWYWTDAWILPDNPLASYWTTSLVGSTLALSLWATNSLLAPPATFLLDGPSTDPPPVAVTLLSSHYSVSLSVDQKPPTPSISIHIADILVSFVILPFAVVWFWRGSWLVLDYHFWGLTTDPHDVHVSLAWGTLMFFFCLWITNEPIFSYLNRRIVNPAIQGLISRLRTWILAWGTVSFWRVVWLV